MIHTRLLARRTVANFRFAGRTLQSVGKSTISVVAIPGQRRYFSTDFDSDDEDNSSRKKTALVLGSFGCLGRAVVRHLALQLNMQVLGADVVELPNDTDTILDGFISVPNLKKNPALADITSALVEGVSNNLGDGDQIDVIVCASGGWQGDPEMPKPDATDAEVIAGARAYGETIDKMISMNLYPVLAAGYVAHRFMAPEGMCEV